jgi:hypothetical protein
MAMEISKSSQASLRHAWRKVWMVTRLDPVCEDAAYACFETLLDVDRKVAVVSREEADLPVG